MGQEHAQNVQEGEGNDNYILDTHVPDRSHPLIYRLCSS